MTVVRKVAATGGSIALLASGAGNVAQLYFADQKEIRSEAAKERAARHVDALEDTIERLHQSAVGYVMKLAECEAAR